MNVGKVQHKIGPAACQSILVLHALGGCDTTSAVFGIGKGFVYKHFNNDERNSSNLEIMQSPSSTVQQVSHAGIQLMISMYGGKSADSLPGLRYAAYCRQVSSSLRGLQPERLPPSHNAGHYHILRVHFQAVDWKLLHGTHALDPLSWGWKLEKGRYEPVMSDQPIAPEDILTVVRCACQTSKCDSGRCSCKSNGLHCVAACRHCHGTDCCNSDTQVTIAAGATSCSEDDEKEVGSRSDFSECIYYDALDYGDEEVVV